MRIIYADSVLLLNFIIDYLLVLSTGKICSLPLKRWRMALAALLGGIYAVLSLRFPDFFALASCKILSGLCLCAIAFAHSGSFIRTAAVFFAVSAAFGGAVYAALSLGGINPKGGFALPISMRTLVLSFALCYVLLSAVFRGAAKRGRKELGGIEIFLRGRSISLQGLRDTGNELRDNKGYPVIIAEWEAFSPLFPELSSSQELDPAALLLAIDSLEDMKGRCCLLPCLTATAPSALLPCIRPDEILIGGKKAPHCLVALIRGPLSRDGSYKALY